MCFISIENCYLVKSMNRIYLLIFVLIISISNSDAQKFNVSEVDAQLYPTVSANFSAFNILGEYYTNLTKQDFRVVENGLEVSPDLINLECTSNLPVNVVLVLDKSSSMQDKYDGETLWQWALEGARTFINTFPFSDSSKIAITSFSGGSTLVCGWSNNKKELLDSILKMPAPYGSTDMNGPFFNENNGAFALLKTRPAHYRRAIVFLSDGEHDSGEALRRQEIVTQLNSLNIRFFGITLMLESSNDFDFWAVSTNGKSVYVSSKAALNSIYKTFAEDLKMTVQCRLEWESPEICDISETYRKAEIFFVSQDMNVTRNYRVAESAIVSVDQDQEIYNFGDPPIGQTTERDIIITPQVSPFRITNLSVAPDEYFEIIDFGNGVGKPPVYPIIVQPGTNKKFTIRYTPLGERKYRQSTLTINGLPCPIEIPLHGGFHQIEIENPVDAAIYSRCDTIDIIWSGVDAKVFVDLYYSTDGGSRWILIKDKVTGNLYKWHPGFTNENLMVKAKVSEQFAFDFVRTYGGAGNEFITSVEVQNNGLYHFASGYFSGSLEIADIKKPALGSEDLFVAKFDLDGNPVWVNTAGTSNKDDRANGVSVDVRGFVYVTGFTYQGIKFGNVSPSLEMSNTKYLYVAKYSPAGQFINVAFIGASISLSDFQAEGLKIKNIYKIGEQNKIAVIGRYSGTYNNIRLNRTLPAPDTDALFSAIFDEQLNLLDIMPGTPDNLGFSDLTAIHTASQTTYKGDSYTGIVTVEKNQFTSKGQSDFWISKYARSPVSQDITEVFEMVRPSAVFKISEYDFGPIVFGDEIEQTATGVLTNNGKLPYLINRYKIRDAGGAVINDFKLTKDIVGTIINPGESIDLELWFRPGALSQRNAILTISGDCASDIMLNLKGNGMCGGLAPEVHVFGDVNLNKQKFDTLICVFQNISETPTMIAPQIRGLHFGDFQRILPDYVKAKEVNGRIPVAPQECIDIIVVFEPKSLGLREAELNFFVSSPCKNSVTKLIGNGITSDIGVTSYDWGERLVNGSYDATIELVNNSNVPEVVQNIQFEKGNIGNVLTFEKPSDSFNIPANGKVTINVQFNPTAEISYSDEILVFLGSRAEPVVSYLTGIGILPKLETIVDCGEKVNVGETTTGGITLINPSTSAVLNIKSIEIENDDEFVFPQGTVTTDIVIEKGGNITLPVLFTPISGGDNSDNFIIIADDYDGTFTDLWKTTIEPIECDGLDVEFPDIVNFGSLLVCTERTLPITIKNKSRDTDLTIRLSEMEINGVDASEFELPVLQNRTLKGGESYTFEIIFNPQSKGNLNAELSIPNSMASPFKIELIGKSEGIELQSNNKEITVMTGERIKYVLKGKLPGTYSGMINNIKITFSADAIVLGIVPSSIKTGSEIGNDFTWGEIKALGGGYFEITGTGFLIDNRTIELMSFDIQTYLNDKHRTLLVAEIDYGCATDLFELTIVNTDPVCQNDNRVIQMMSGHKFGLSSPIPNPVSESFILNYGVGFDAETKMEIINYFGETVKTIYSGQTVKAGTYSETIPTVGLSSGTYMIRMISGPYSETKPLLIVK